MSHTCPNCDFEIECSEFLPHTLKCPSCNKEWVMDWDCDTGDNYWSWITSEEVENNS